jgi:FkbM family methyltransferase
MPTGLPLPVVRGPLKGRWWVAGAAAGPGKGLSVLVNASEPGQAALADQLALPESVCFDIGANAGFYSLIFARRARVVYSFEPLPRNLRFLTRLVELNRLKNVRIVPGAVSDAPGIAMLSEGSTPAEAALSENGNQPVLTTTCDTFVQETGTLPDVVKVDVEGAEAHVLRGAASTFKKHHPAILLSIHSDTLREECLSILESLGYNRFNPLDTSCIEDAMELAAFSE